MTLSLRRRAALWDDRTAVVEDGGDRPVSYADLDAEADGMARRLAGLGVEAGDVVAVLSRPRVEILALLFAVRRLGAVLAPVSHRLTPATVAAPLDAVAPAVVVHEAGQRDLVRAVADDRLYSFEELGREADASYETADRGPEDSLLYLHATRETDRPAVGESDAPDRRGETRTEDPPGAGRVVDVPERAVEWNCITAAAAWGLGRGDCAPTVLPLSDTDGLHRLVLPLLYVGGRVVVLRAYDPEDALAAVDGAGVTALFAGATEYRDLVAADGFEATDFGDVSLVATGTALPADVRTALADRAPLVRTYGRVETGPNDLYRPPGSTAADPDCVGRPFPDCEARIVDRDGEPVPEGEAGELQFRGPVTPRGYLGREPFPEWVPTGDLAVRESGDYYLVGRVGEALDAGEGRVHPGAIERALTAREDVTAAGVVADDEGLLGVFVGDADPGELRDVLADELPEEVPVRELVRVESLPRRDAGDPDRAAIRRQFDAEERFEEG